MSKKKNNQRRHIHNQSSNRNLSSSSHSAPSLDSSANDNEDGFFSTLSALRGSLWGSSEPETTATAVDNVPTNTVEKMESQQEAEIARLRKSMTSLKESMETKEQSNKAMVRSLRTLLEESKQDSRTLKEMHAALETAYSSLEGKKNDIFTELKSKEAVCLKLEEKLKQKEVAQDETIQNLEKKNRSLEAKMDAVNQSKEDAFKKAQQVELNVTNLQNELDTLTLTANQSKQGFEAEREQLVAKIGKLEKDMNKKAKSVKDMETQVEEAKAARSAIEKQLESSIEDKTKATNEKEHALLQLEKLQVEIDEYKQEIRKLNARSEANAQVAQDASANNSLVSSQALENAILERDEAIQNNERTQAELNEAKEIISKMESELKDANEKIVEIEHVKKHFESTFNESKQKIALLTENMKTQMNDDKARTSKEQEQAAKLQQLEARIQSLSDASLAQTTKVKFAEEQLKIVKDVKFQYEARNEELMENIEELKKQLEAEKTQNSHLSSQTLNAQRGNEDTRKVLKEMRNEKEGFLGRIAILENEKKILQSECEESRAQYEALVQNVEETKKNSSMDHDADTEKLKVEFELKLKESNQKLQDLEKNLESTKKDLDSEKQRADKAELRVKELEAVPPKKKLRSLPIGAEKPSPANGNEAVEDATNVLASFFGL